MTLFLSACSTVNTNTQIQKTDDELLQETVELSKKVKEFGRTLGIKPSSGLTKSSLEKAITSSIDIYVQEKNKIGKPPYFSIYFSVACENIPLRPFNNYLAGHAVYLRCNSQFASEDATIALEFARASMARKVEVILHEDLHINTKQLYDSTYIESLVTPLGRLVALKFFESIGDLDSQNKVIRYISTYRSISKEIVNLVSELRALYSQSSSGDTSNFTKALEILDRYPAYRKLMSRELSDQYFDAAFEAKISHDLMYYKDFDRIVTLYEKIGDLKTLIEEIKKAPGSQEAIEKYLDELDQKYSAAK
ncbi:MAG: hypothetical protein Q7S12_01365 [bacterium]|nr:hypothetical protein [bacterium]